MQRQQQSRHVFPLVLLTSSFKSTFLVVLRPLGLYVHTITIVSDCATYPQHIHPSFTRNILLICAIKWNCASSRRVLPTDFCCRRCISIWIICHAGRYVGSSS